MEKVYTIKTNYFYKPWTWIKRLLELLVALAFLWWFGTLEDNDTGPEYSWVKYVLFGIAVFYILSRPKDGLAVDEQYLHYIKKSIIPFFSRTTKYEISKMKSIGCGGVYDSDTEFLIKGNSYRNRLEIIFRDNSSKSHDVTIYKTELKEIVTRVQWLINQNSA